MKVLSLFSGIGAFEKALDNLGIPWELVAFCEIDNFASKSYVAIHDVPESMNLGDITKVNKNLLPKDIDLLTYGFPCQDISNAGTMKGFFNPDGTHTRSGLFFEAMRIIEGTMPKVAIAENVKMLTSKKFATEFKIVLKSLEDAGYNNYFQVLNAKNYGIPQNRERVFIVSIRKDVDNGSFVFPKSVPLKLKLKDFLDEIVDEKYFIKKELSRKLVIEKPISEPQALRLVRSEHGKQIRKKYENGEVVEPWSSMKQLEPRNDGCSNTISTVLKDNYILVREATKAGYAEAIEGDSVYLGYPASKTRRGRVGNQISQTLTTKQSIGVVVNGMRIRYLTPKESFKLMGFTGSDFQKAEAVSSERQLYKQAGNSIVVSVVQSITQSLLKSGVFSVSTVRGRYCEKNGRSFYSLQREAGGSG